MRHCRPHPQPRLLYVVYESVTHCTVTSQRTSRGTLPPQEAQDTASAASPDVLDTTGLNTLDLGGDNTIEGFDDDGNLVDTEGNIIIPAAEIPDLSGDTEDEG